MFMVILHGASNEGILANVTVFINYAYFVWTHAVVQHPSPPTTASAQADKIQSRFLYRLNPLADTTNPLRSGFPTSFKRVRYLLLHSSRSPPFLKVNGGGKLGPSIMRERTWTNSSRFGVGEGAIDDPACPNGDRQGKVSSRLEHLHRDHLYKAVVDWGT